MSRKQYFGIKYPFSNNDIEKYELDLNTNEVDRVTSDILHLVFTPKGQRLRMPDYGTNLIQYIFDISDESLWPSVKKDVQETVSKWIIGVKINDIQVVASEDGKEIYVRLDYSVQNGNYIYKKSVAVEL